MLMWWLRRRSAFIAHFPSAILLSVGYAYTAVLLTLVLCGVDIGVRVDSPLHNYGWEFALISAAFAAWHGVGYFGIPSDRWRKLGYIVSGAWLGGFATVLLADDRPLAAGYVACACLVALFSFWRYPRHHEG